MRGRELDEVRGTGAQSAGLRGLVTSVDFNLGPVGAASGIQW